jgi:glutathione synthase
MSLSVAIQMDPIEPVNIDADSTFALAIEAQARGHKMVHYLPKHMSLQTKTVTARVRDLTVQRKRGDHAQLGPERRVDLADFDVVLLRQDPPFDLNYITTTHILDHIHPKTLVVNDPTSVRNAPEKLLVTHFPDLGPPTLITNDPQEVLRFRAQYREIIVKPLYGNGGAGVFRVGESDENLNSVLEMMEALYRAPYVVQAYLKEVRAGDKRIILVDGVPVGALNRRPKEGEARANLHVGGTAEAIDITPREHEICAEIGPLLRERGLIFVGIDVIGGNLTEINVTSPTGVQEITRFSGVNIAGLIWDAIEKRRAG